MKKYYYSYEEFLEDTKELAKLAVGFEPDTLLAIARGGLTLGHFMAQALNMRRLFAVNSIHYNETKKLDTFEIFNMPDLSSAKRVLVIDDIVDSGETMDRILHLLKERYPDVTFKTAVLFYKRSAVLQADFKIKEAKEWIDFFWEIDPVTR